MKTLLVYNGKSFMKSKNKGGPKIEPCGTPQDMGLCSQLSRLTLLDLIYLLSIACYFVVFVQKGCLFIPWCLR